MFKLRRKANPQPRMGEAGAFVVCTSRPPRWVRKHQTAVYHGIYADYRRLHAAADETAREAHPCNRLDTGCGDA